MLAKTLMIQGTGSHAGKSVIVTALCRAFARRGVRVAPFKAQNMALNSFVTAEGSEIGWAQAVQAQAAGLLPHVDFNPVLLKPSADQRCQVILQGHPFSTLHAGEYEKLKPKLWGAIREALDRLRKNYELVIMEGAGSPAEINLKKNDIVNMRVARYAGAPVLLVSDIDRGGVFASFVGTMSLLSHTEKNLVKGLIINKFRGDLKILRPGLAMLQKKTRRPVLGVLPWFPFDYQDQEDSVALEPAETCTGAGLSPDKIQIAVVRTPRISNFTDFDSLRLEPRVHLFFAHSPEALSGADCIILPGSKNTMEDLAWLKRAGMAQAICRAAHKGVFVMGICAGYQMLGRTIRDPGAVESAGKSARGLNLLDVQTVFFPEKSLHQVEGTFSDTFETSSPHPRIHGYEIHMGQTTRSGQSRPLFVVHCRSGKKVSQEEGAINPQGNVMGTYIHGLLANDSFRHALLRHIARRKGSPLRLTELFRDFEGYRRKNWDRLADWLEENLDTAAVCKIADIS